MHEEPGSLRRDIEASLTIEDTPAEVEPHTALVSINIDPSALPTEVLPHTDIVNKFFEVFRSTLDISKT